MSFSNGSTALTICKLSGALPDLQETLSKLNACAFGLIDNVRAEPRIGFAGYSHVESPVDEANAVCGGFLRFQLVKAVRKVPSSLLKNECRKQELAFMATNDTNHILSKERKRIKAEVIERLVMKMPPSISATEIAIDNKGACFIASNSAKAVDEIIALFFKATEVEIVPLSVNALATENGTQEGDIPYLGKTPNLSRDFLTWLWYFSDEFGGKLEGVETLVEAPLVLSMEDEAKGAMESSVKKGGCPTASAESTAALRAGKKLKKCKISFVKNSQIWHGTFDADKLAFSGLTLPEGEAMEVNARFAECIGNLNELAGFVRLYFAAYLEKTKDIDSFSANMCKWVEERESY